MSLMGFLKAALFFTHDREGPYDIEATQEALYGKGAQDAQMASAAAAAQAEPVPFVAPPIEEIHISEAYMAYERDKIERKDLIAGRTAREGAVHIKAGDVGMTTRTSEGRGTQTYYEDSQVLRVSYAAPSRAAEGRQDWGPVDTDAVYSLGDISYPKNEPKVIESRPREQDVY